VQPGVIFPDIRAGLSQFHLVPPPSPLSCSACHTYAEFQATSMYMKHCHPFPRAAGGLETRAGTKIQKRSLSPALPWALGFDMVTTQMQSQHESEFTHSTKRVHLPSCSAA